MLLMIVIVVGYAAGTASCAPIRRPLIDDPDERFKYGSIGAEQDAGIPYWIFYVLPRVFSGQAAGAGRLRLVRRGLGAGQGTADRLQQEDASASTASPTTAPSAIPRATAPSIDSNPVLVPTGPNHTLDLEAFFRFLSTAPRTRASTPTP